MGLKRTHRGLRPGKSPYLACAALAALCIGPAIIEGETPNPVIRVEEDWELVLNEPDVDVEAPQFHTVMSPFGDSDGIYAQVLWNYREYLEDYLPGGLQIQCWKGEDKLKDRFVEKGQLSLYQEQIQWTQSLETDGSLVSFAVQNGNSTTWGVFGKDLSLTAEAPVADLGGYTTDYSVDNSWITYGANRVTSLKITEVRYYGPSGLLYKDTSDRVIFSAPAE